MITKSLPDAGNYGNPVSGCSPSRLEVCKFENKNLTELQPQLIVCHQW